MKNMVKPPSRSPTGESFGYRFSLDFSPERATDNSTGHRPVENGKKDQTVHAKAFFKAQTFFRTEQHRHSKNKLHKSNRRQKKPFLLTNDSITFSTFLFLSALHPTFPTLQQLFF
ncbi:MAG: hypothetical protein Q8S54_08880 [Bacteroidota bacterium]|nr:hypothetical protein [Bacteroidota bacterium]